MFEISGFDTAGVVSLKRLSLVAALKKARELVEDGGWDAQVVDPTWRVHTPLEAQAAWSWRWAGSAAASSRAR
ncbi:hypothetical protein [Bradyrhizobium japonicum]|jgi:hypothetical protein|uniref:hypothetical protein n=1 Tax=Bradyrhizobium japonicum TaxID=375 RepID=UPI0020A08EE7|nr:hypothetical protein [Bradyrhizobium japonicum]MCP1765875.1 hypothetical protein [Bradyrhizobium japonicum]MCP1788012.1 hypothetical protein [Bradyrhizobium japonicum]MCP1809888.1 hypothetical protein [Bradyrhizobium japonicum]MCP1818822.1 hypothetical protein [Bradyrhizobium japonicum]MCP1869668.1 hypothetical protein [Bradyrhizobium japonicum]